MNKILIIAAHPDDEILGCGGFLAKYGGESSRVVFVAEGTSCRFNSDEINDKHVTNKIAERNGFCVKSLSTFGITDIKFYNYPCGRLDVTPIIDINKLIESEINDFKPQTVLTHSEFDNNNEFRFINRFLCIYASHNFSQWVFEWPSSLQNFHFFISPPP